MLTTNQRVEKVMAARVDFIERGMLPDDRRPLRPEDPIRDNEGLPEAPYIDVDDAEAVEGEVESEISLPQRAGLFLVLVQAMVFSYMA